MLATIALVLSELPWSSPSAVPVAVLCLLGPAALLAIVVQIVGAGLRPVGARYRDELRRAAVPVTAIAVGSGAFIVGAIASNLAFVDEPVEGNTLRGYAASAAAALGISVALARSARFRRWMGGIRWARALVIAPAVAGSGIAALDAIAFPEHYLLAHGALAVVAVIAFLVASDAALAHPAALARRTTLAAAGAALLVALLGAVTDDGLRAASVRACVAHPTVHRRLVMGIRALADMDGDGFSAWLGGGDCDDDDAAAYPMSIEGEPCFVLSSSPPSAPARRADEAVGRAAPRVIILATIDAFRCGFGEPWERPELRDACPELARLGESGLLRTDAHTVYPATMRSLAAIHATREGHLTDALGELGYHRVMIPGTPLVIGTEATRGRFDEIREDVHEGRASGRACSAHRVSDAVVQSLVSAVREHDRVFVWAHYFDPHAPYVSEPDQTLVLDADVDRFAAEIRRTDAAIGELARALREHPELADAVLFVTSDHSEEFGEHGGIRHGANLHETSTRVPMLAWRAGSDAREGLPRLLPAGGDDVAEYLLAVASGSAVEARDEVTMRVQLQGNEQWGIVSEREKLIYHRSFGHFELFDLEADPWERRDLAAERPDDALRLLSVLHLRASERANEHSSEHSSEHSGESTEAH